MAFGVHPEHFFLANLVAAAPLLDQFGILGRIDCFKGLFVCVFFFDVFFVFLLLSYGRKEGRKEARKEGLLQSI